MAALLFDARPSGEPIPHGDGIAGLVPGIECMPLGRLFSFDEIGWLETEALSARLRAAWPGTADGVAAIADAHRAVPVLRALGEHPRLLAGRGAARRLARSWLAFGRADLPPPVPGTVRIAVCIGATAPRADRDRRGEAFVLDGTGTLPRDAAGLIHFVADHAPGPSGAAGYRDDALWPAPWACAG